ncbi:MAG TPA: PIG-L family deacetylase [Gemmataceae bacterium]|nr:PIG-L family deacetylase [Gemmataceae bacterium]
MAEPRILIVGAHPDDADLKAGGTASLWRRRGWDVKLVSVTDGRSGHHLQHGPALAQRRRAEARAAGAVIGATYEVLEFPDGALMPTLEARHTLIRLIRGFQPDLLLTHRPNDYHPDHRYTSVLVQDAAYLLTVPAVCPDAPHLMRDPVILYFCDDFQKPTPFRPDVVVDVGAVVERVVDMLHCHASQFYEWLPYNGGYAAEAPAEEPARRRWLEERFHRCIRPLADRYRDLLVRTYGQEQGGMVEYVEAFEASEYGAALDEAARQRLFPFLPARQQAAEGPSH